jgi:hypothetical protein
MTGFYKSFILKETFRLTEQEALAQAHYFKTVELSPASFSISERYVAGNLDWVFYYNTEPSETLFAFHKEKYGEKNFAILKDLSAKSVSVTEFVDFTVQRIWLYNLDEHERIRKEYLFSPNYELTDYRENFYDEEGVLVKEKVFFPDIWHIEEEEN